MSPDDLTCVKREDREKLFAMLVKKGYLDSHGRVLGKFIFSAKNRFELEGREEDSGRNLQAIVQERTNFKQHLSKDGNCADCTKSENFEIWF